MSEPIKVGDLVMVVRWPHDCINPKGVIGTPFRVTSLVQRIGKCNRCYKPIADADVMSALGFDKDASIPINWLKRIDPDAELESVDEKETLHA